MLSYNHSHMIIDCYKNCMEKLYKLKYLNGKYYVEVNDHRYKIHPTEKIILRKRDLPPSLRYQYQVQNNTQNKKN